jgi:hypothetical protein
VSTVAVTNFTQENTTTFIRSNFIGAIGRLAVVGPTGQVVILKNTEANVGNVSNPEGGDPLYEIDQFLFSTTEQRKAAQAYFAGGVGIEKDLAVGGFIYGRVAAANTATTSSNVTVLEVNDDRMYYPLFTDVDGLVLTGSQLYADNLDGAGTQTPDSGLQYNPFTGMISTERVLVKSDETSTSPETGALTVAGGAGILADVFVGGVVTLEDETNAIAADEGALVVAGGIGVGQDVFVGGIVTVDDDTNAASITEGALIVAGGAGITKDVFVGGIVTVEDETNATAADEGALIVAGGVGVGQDVFVGGIVTVDDDTNSASITEGALIVAGGVGITKDVFVGGVVTVEDETDSTSIANGALVVAGGVGIGATVNVGGDILPAEPDAGSIGAQDLEWADAYLNKIYSKFIGSTASGLTLAPGTGITDVFGDIRVRGQNPIGTAPVVTNTLYVTVDGNDTNDGRAMDASRACRTIGGAINSPYYQPGTQILVSAGRYLEDNPLVMKPYTSIRGADIRTTFIEPINKTQDLFHVNSGCYLNYMSFLNGRSGRLEGAYAEGYNRGAYATAFPPQTGENRIDLFNSPYIQNCTNQSGPWLKDGTMFVPNQTVQVPLAIGQSTWESNTASIVVNMQSGSVEIGQSINAGKQTQGFFNARTLLLANKPFIQSQAVAWVSVNFPSFVYNEQLCYRDAGILIENMAYDMAFGGNEKSIDSGRSYFRGVISVIAGQETQTVGAIDYISYLSQLVVQNEVCPVLTPPPNIPVGTQVINTVLTGGDIVVPSIEKLFNITTGIIENGPDSAPDLFNGQGPDAAYVSAEVLLQANRKFIQENAIIYINNFLCDPPKALPYSQIKCRRDTGLIVDSIATDLLFSTPSNTQATFAGIQYFNQANYVGIIEDQLIPTIAAITYLRDLSLKVVQNITTATDALIGVTRYTNGVQTTASNYASITEVNKIQSEFSNILTILNGRTDGWSDLIVPDTGIESIFPSVRNTVNMLIANTTYLADEVVAFVNATYPLFVYSTSTCARDVGYIIQSVCFDLLYGGNKQSIVAGLSYYSTTGTSTVIPGETTATVDAFTFMGNLASTLVQGQTYYPLQSKVKPVITLPASDSNNASTLVNIVNTITNIIANGPDVAAALAPVTLIKTLSTSTINAHSILKANRQFIIEETITYIDQTYNPNSFNYNQEKCFRDTGLIVDAVSQDILLGGNQKSIEAGLSYWTQGYNYVAGQESTTTAAINYVRDISLQVIANTTVTTYGNSTPQIINTFYQYGGDYMPQQAISRNFGIITDIIENGIAVAPPVYAGGGLFALNGLNGSSVVIATKVTSVEELEPDVYRIGLDTPTVGFGDNATLIFGDTQIFPLQDPQVEALCLELGLDANTWNERKVDPIGAMGGALIDGAVISDRSPIQSFVFDAYTQLNQGGIGVKVTNNGYSQLVSVFTIFCSVGVECDRGGIASITNSNCNFGDISLLAKGFGRRDFSGTVYNPAFRAYPFSPNVPGSGFLDQFYPNGYWPNNGGQVEIFVPDSENRPHIGQVMEVIPPKDYLNEQGLSGFLNAFANTSTINTGTINLVDISTTDVYIGNTLVIRDQFGREVDDNGVRYVATGTVVKDVNFNSISLNQALTSGGGDPTNPTFFTMYFSGNSYYTVQTSQIAEDPYAVDTNKLSANTDPYFEGPAIDQIAAHLTTLNYLKSVVDDVITNTAITPTIGNSSTQAINITLTGGENSQAFVDLRFDQMINIIGAANIAAARLVVPQNAIAKTGTIPQGAGSAIALIENNIEFISEEIAAYVTLNLASGLGSYDQNKCRRDIKLILQQLLYDLQTGGNYNMVYSGLSYWSRAGTYHIVQLGEAVNRPDLFPNGSTVNFYQRSYISASGYLFEYVGAGTNYGALPQRGVADPVQAKETVQLNSGKVFFTSTDQNGDFRIGPGLVISQATGVLSGRTFVQSLYANMTPFILAIS